jgi:transcriptional regulator with PAS, ATPase and Fis domain
MDTNKMTDLLSELTKHLDDFTNKNKLIYDAKLEWEYTFDAIPDLIIMTDLGGRIRRINLAVKESFNKRYKDFLGRCCDDIFECTQEMQSTDNCPRKKCIITSQKQTSIIFFKGLNSYCNVVCAPVFDCDKNIIGTVHIIRNIDEDYQNLQQKNECLSLIKELLITNDFDINYELRMKLKDLLGEK